MIKTGSKMDTSFRLSVVRDGNEETLPFSDLLTRPTVVSVYMKNNTSSCDIQNQQLAASWEWFDKKGVNVIAVSKDTCGSHKKYAQKLGASYILASDPDGLFSNATDSIVTKSMYGKSYEAPSRSAFFIGTDGTVLGVIEKVTPKEHAEELKRLVESAG